MKLLSYKSSVKSNVGFLKDDHVIPIHIDTSNGASAMRTLLSGGRELLKKVRQEAENKLENGEDLLSYSDVDLDSLVPDPTKILCIGFNYMDHANEMEVDIPAEPNIFAKFNNALCPDGGEIIIPAASNEIDYEGELVVVIGKRCSRVSRDFALDYVAGYTMGNDVSARDLQFQTTQYTLGKSVDTFAPVGPVMKLSDEIPDPTVLRVTTRLNGKVMQDESVGKMVYSIPHIIESISSVITLEPGDLIFTGTPTGVGWKQDPICFMKAGDTVEVEVSGIGTLTNVVVKER